MLFQCKQITRIAKKLLYLCSQINIWKNFFHFLTLSLIWLIVVHTQIIYFLQYLSFGLLKVYENRLKNVLLGQVYLDQSSLVSASIWLKYHKKTRPPNCSARGVNLCQMLQIRLSVLIVILKGCNKSPASDQGSRFQASLCLVLQNSQWKIRFHNKSCVICETFSLAKTSSNLR